MRTITSTFPSRDEAERARRRLEAIGVEPDRIVLKDLADPLSGSGASAPGDSPGALGGAFLSVKVSPEQIRAATEILKHPPREDAASAPPDASSIAPSHGAPVESVTRPMHAVGARPDASRPESGSSGWARTLIYLGGLAVIFLIGWLIGSSV